MKTLCLLIAVLSIVALLPVNAEEVPKYKNTSLSFEVRTADLVSRMTLEEKATQMIHAVPAIERLGVPAFNWANECLHGILTNDVTSFPQAIGMAASWDNDLLYQVATAISDEARAKYNFGKSENITFWSPNINIFRDPRWGRGQETYGEDPYLTSRMAVSYVKGLQGDDPVYLKCVSTPKHFAVHSGPDPLRHQFDVSVSKHDLWDTYLPAFEATICEAKAQSVMGAYNRLDGEPCCSNKLLLQTILRHKWGFSGYVVSDCGAIENIWQTHKVVDTPEKAAARAVLAGCDLACFGDSFKTLPNAVKQGLLTEKDLDKAVTRLMLTRMKLGLFDSPEKVKYNKIPIDVVDSTKHKELARQMGRESMVLLRNNGNLLPLDKTKIKTLAVVGSLADTVMRGDYSGTPKHSVSILEGIKNCVESSVRVEYQPGPTMPGLSGKTSVMPSSVLDADGTPGLRGEYFNNKDMSGQPAVTRVDAVIDFDWRINGPKGLSTTDGFSVRWSGNLTAPASGEYSFALESDDGSRLYIDDKLVIDNWGDHGTVLREGKIDLIAGKTYKIKIEYYDNTAFAVVRLSWKSPDDTTDDAKLQAAADAVKKADAAILVLGVGSDSELDRARGEIVETEFLDRASIGLPKSGEKLLEAVYATGKPFILVLVSGSALSIPWAAEHVPAIVEAWYGSEEGGNAVADVLFGKYSPAGRMPVTSYESESQLPDFKDYRMDNRTYRYFKGTPLFPFGFGLSYTKFAYSDLRISKKSVSAGRDITVSAKVENTGKQAGDEVMQVYLTDMSASSVVPIRKLVGFKRISLEPGEKKAVSFKITPELMSFVNSNGDRILEPGGFAITCGGSQGDERSLALGASAVLTGKFTVTGQTMTISTSSVGK